MEIEKPFKCSTCNSRFTNEGHLQVHRKRHEMSLNLSKSGGLNLSNNGPDGFVDETPTPTRFIRNCEEVGLFQDLQNQSLINPFDLQFTKAASATPSSEHYEFNFSITSTSKKLRVDDTLNTPQVFGYSVPTTSSSSSSTSSNSGSIIPSGLITSSSSSSLSTTILTSSTTVPTTASSSLVIQNSSVSTATSSSLSHNDDSNNTTTNTDALKINLNKDKRTTDSNNLEKNSTSDENHVESTTPDNESFNIPRMFSNITRNNSNNDNNNSKIQTKKLRLNLTPVENIESPIESSKRLLSDPILSSTGIHTLDHSSGEGIQSVKISYFDQEGVDILKQSHINNKKSNSSKKETPNLDEDKKTELLERNRAAASRSRERRKQWVSALETRIQTLQNLLSVTQHEVIKLRQENKTLREQLGKYTNSDDVSNTNNTDKSTHEPCYTNETQSHILKHSSSTCVTSNSINPTVPILPFPRQLPPTTKAKRGRPRKGTEKKVAQINIPPPVNTVSCSISVPKSPAVINISPRNFLPSRSLESTNHPQVLPSNTNNTVLTPIKVEIVPIQQLSNVFLLKPQKN